MTNGTEKLPRPASELEALATYYDEHDTADEMEDGRWVEPMVTTSLRLPRELFDQLKEDARREGKRHTAYIREILERSQKVREDSADAGELKKINRKLDTLLRTVQPSKESPTRRSAQKVVAPKTKTSKTTASGKGAKSITQTGTGVKGTA